MLVCVHVGVSASALPLFAHHQKLSPDQRLLGMKLCELFAPTRCLREGQELLLETRLSTMLEENLLHSPSLALFLSALHPASRGRWQPGRGQGRGQGGASGAPAALLNVRSCCTIIVMRDTCASARLFSAHQ